MEIAIGVVDTTFFTLQVGKNCLIIEEHTRVNIDPLSIQTN
jgi:hypothetical protein